MRNIDKFRGCLILQERSVEISSEHISIIVLFRRNTKSIWNFMIKLFLWQMRYAMVRTYNAASSHYKILKGR